MVTAARGSDLTTAWLHRMLTTKDVLRGVTAYFLELHADNNYSQ
uniref:Uncharacterized protein n=1 Tax=Arundo donax TaxID=35708 RepID=A0A0A8YH12_ARUDO